MHLPRGRALMCVPMALHTHTQASEGSDAIWARAPSAEEHARWLAAAQRSRLTRAARETIAGGRADAPTEAPKRATSLRRSVVSIVQIYSATCCELVDDTTWRYGLLPMAWRVVSKKQTHL